MARERVGTAARRGMWTALVEHFPGVEVTTEDYGPEVTFWINDGAGGEAGVDVSVSEPGEYLLWLQTAKGRVCSASITAVEEIAAATSVLLQRAQIVIGESSGGLT